MRRKFHLVGLIAVIACVFVSASEQEILQDLKPDEKAQVMRYVEELFVEGERLHGDDMNLLEMDRVYGWKETAARTFKSGQYEKAFPQLLMLARLGFKDSQARVAYIYLHGLGGQQKSNLEALGWLGTAIEGETRPAYRNLFNEMMAQVPAAQQAVVNDHISEYRNKYGAESRGVNCGRSRTGHISKFVCRYRREANELFLWRSLYGFLNAP